MAAHRMPQFQPGNIEDWAPFKSGRFFLLKYQKGVEEMILRSFLGL